MGAKRKLPSVDTNGVVNKKRRQSTSKTANDDTTVKVKRVKSDNLRKHSNANLSDESHQEGDDEVASSKTANSFKHNKKSSSCMKHKKKDKKKDKKDKRMEVEIPITTTKSSKVQLPTSSGEISSNWKKLLSVSKVAVKIMERS